MAEEEVALMSQDEAYEVLGLPKGVDWSEIKHAYKYVAYPCVPLEVQCICLSMC